MNHNIRYEARHVSNLDFSIAIHQGTGTANYEDSVGEHRLEVKAMVYNIDLDLWWYAAAGNLTTWTQDPPNIATPFAPGNDNPTNYAWDMTNPLPSGPFPFMGLYSIAPGDFTTAHDKLHHGNAEKWDTAAGGVVANLGPNSGEKGYLVYIRGVGAPLGVTEITEYLQIMPVEYNVNVVRWDGSAVSNSATGYPNVNISDWGGTAAVLTKEAAGNLPNINVESYASSPAQISGGLGLPDINVVEWNSSIQGNSTSGLPQVDVQEYKDAIVATTTPGIPEVNIVSVNDNTGAADGLEDFATNGYDRTAHKVEVVKTVDVGGISESSFSDNAISERVINAAAITNEKFDDDAIDHRVIKDGAIKETKFDGDAISARVIATDAIDEDAIKIDSVTYEEISDSAVREIVSGIWNASVFGPIDQSVDGFGVKNYAGTNPALAEPGTMGHAMLISYLSKHLSHASGAIGSTATPMHTSKLDDPTGSKFYSKWLDATPLLDPEETKSYVDRSAIIFRGLSSDGSVDPAISQHHLVRIAGIKTDPDGQYFEIHLMDEDQTLVPGGITAEVGFSLGDILIIKAETDATMHEVAHEVWEESASDHSNPDTFGMLNRIIAGLSQFNHQITDSKYDPSGRLLSCRLVVYANSDDARSGSSPLTTIEVSSNYDEKQNMTKFIAAEEK